MRATLTKIGNKRGIIIPDVLLDTCSLDGDVELSIRGKSLVIETAKELRVGWFDDYQLEEDADLLGTLPVDEGDSEWVW